MTTEQRDALRDLQDTYISILDRAGLKDDDMVAKGVSLADFRTTLYPRLTDAIRAILAGEPTYQ
jgi:hypothetical protein